MDVTPRPAPEPTSRFRRKSLPALVILVVVVVALGFVVVRSLGSATVFFYNADEAVQHHDELGNKRFRLQGTVVDGSVQRTAEGVSFLVVYQGVTVPVDHVGDPPELFQPNIPVVLEGHFEQDSPNGAFASDRILVKHSEEYDEKNPHRVKEANDGGVTPSSVTP